MGLFKNLLEVDLYHLNASVPWLIFPSFYLYPIMAHNLQFCCSQANILSYSGDIAVDLFYEIIDS